MSDYYGELCTKLYESSKSLSEGKELDFYLSFIKDENMKVLEPMCGNGRMLIPFMQNGIRIEGFDISEEMLKVCKAKGEKLNLKPNVWYGKIEEYKGNHQFDLIIIPFGSFSLLPDALVDKSLTNLKSALKSNGKLLLTIMLKHSGIKEFPDWVETERVQFEDEWIITYKKVQYNEKESMLTTRFKYQSVINGQIRKTEMMDFPLRLYALEEFENTIKSNGFNHVVVHGVKDGYGEGTFFYVVECSM
ncbi:class I SAM-dependent methyltransferase [Paenibacillus qinlingensis]|uniref:SAM-dependent methyltransferase n=1 Tax=Paenibacillus qinlingensis TaxID=1837343 RepID=A0ABU1NYN1_9BACL|nr:class I SAM-dependent methyltransferase [Paenibacillus qinlingensis]MDR6552611.1 SAM-dependent methyltransferase [Paenibacillus qinlingensis]